MSKKIRKIVAVCVAVAVIVTGLGFGVPVTDLKAATADATSSATVEPSPTAGPTPTAEPTPTSTVVTNPTVTVKLSAKSVTIIVGKTSQLKVTVKNSKVAPVWKSSNKSIATVSSKGLVTAKAVGEATITVTVGKVKATCSVTVKKATTPTPTVEASLNVLNFNSLLTIFDGALNGGTAGKTNANWDRSNIVTVDATSSATISTITHGGNYLSDPCTTMLKGDPGTATATAVTTDPAVNNYFANMVMLQNGATAQYGDGTFEFSWKISNPYIEDNTVLNSAITFRDSNPHDTLDNSSKALILEAVGGVVQLRTNTSTEKNQLVLNTGVNIGDGAFHNIVISMRDNPSTKLTHVRVWVDDKRVCNVNIKGVTGTGAVRILNNSSPVKDANGNYLITSTTKNGTTTYAPKTACGESYFASYTGLLSATTTNISNLPSTSLSSLNFNSLLTIFDGALNGKAASKTNANWDRSNIVTVDATSSATISTITHGGNYLSDPCTTMLKGDPGTATATAVTTDPAVNNYFANMVMLQNGATAQYGDGAFEFSWKISNPYTADNTVLNSAITFRDSNPHDTLGNSSKALILEAVGGVVQLRTNTADGKNVLVYDTKVSIGDGSFHNVVVSMRDVSGKTHVMVWIDDKLVCDQNVAGVTGTGAVRILSNSTPMKDDKGNYIVTSSIKNGATTYALTTACGESYFAAYNGSLTANLIN